MYTFYYKIYSRIKIHEYYATDRVNWSRTKRMNYTARQIFLHYYLNGCLRNVSHLVCVCLYCVHTYVIYEYRYNKMRSLVAKPMRLRFIVF